MRTFKIKFKTVPNALTKIEYPVSRGYFVKVQAVFYNTNNPSNYLKLYDKDSDQFMFQIPGQGIPNPTTPEIPVSVALPLYYLDIGKGGHEVTIFGELHKQEKFDSGM